MLEVKRKNPSLWRLVDSLEDHLQVRFSTLLNFNNPNSFIYFEYI